MNFFQQPCVTHGACQVTDERILTVNQFRQQEFLIGNRKTENIQQLRLIRRNLILRLLGNLQEVNIQECQCQRYVSQDNDQVQLSLSMDSVGDQTGHNQHQAGRQIGDHGGGSKVLVPNLRLDVRHMPCGISGGKQEVHQMGRKQYESDRLPLSLTPEPYDNGVNEPIFIHEVFDNPIELKDAIEFIKSDDARTKVGLMSGDKVNYLPSRRLKITVDKEAVIRNGIVPANMKDKIVDEIVWEIPSSVSYLYKNDLMLLDFFATNNWTRSVYFTSLSDIKNILGIDKYLHQEGLAHRFMPVEAVSYYKDAGGVFVDGSCELLLSDDIRWGNLNDPDVAVDPESRRSVLFVKQAYMRLAQTLVNSRRKTEAVAVLDKCLEFFPNDKIPYDILMMTYPEIYYAAGATDKGDAFLNTMLGNCIDNLRYYYELEPKFMLYYTESIYENMSILDRMKNIATKYKRNELKMQITKVLEEQNSKFYPYLSR